MKIFGKLAVVLLLAALILVFKALHLENYLTLEWLRAEHAHVQLYLRENPLVGILFFFLLYVLVAASSFPGALILTLAGGVFFGATKGIIIVSLASVIGASVAFLISRFVLKNLLQNHFASRFEKINAEIKKQGAFYLFSMRVIPAFPFFVINTMMGLTEMKWFTFIWVSFIGILPSTIAFVLAGTQIAQVHSLHDLFSVKLFLTFVFIGLFPLTMKKLLQVWSTRKVFKKYKRPKKYDYNLITIGAGAGGLVVSSLAAMAKAKVALVEKNKMGGDCVHTGCVPSKAFIRVARTIAEKNKATVLGLKKIEVNFEFSEVMERIQSVVKRISEHDSREKYETAGVTCISGTAKIRSPFEVEVNGKSFTTRNIVIASGSSPVIPPIPGIEKVNPLTSDNVWALRSRPKKMIVLGGGTIGCELAQCFARLGTEVIQVERSTRILPREDVEISKLVTDVFEKEGIKVITGSQAKLFEVIDGKKVLTIEKERQETKIEFDEVLLALGRKPNTKGFGLEDLQVKITERGNIEGDEYLRTNFPNIFVCGDVTGPFQFTHTASHQAAYATFNALFGGIKKLRVNYRVVPWVTFTDPEIAKVGLSESEAKQCKTPYEVSVFPLKDLDRAITEEETNGFVKVLTIPGKDRILGATIISSRAGEMLCEFVTAMKYDLGLNSILNTIHSYPTFGEANKYVAGVWRKNHLPTKWISFLEKYHAWKRKERSLPF